MCPQILSTIGLILNILGGVIWFFYGFPQPSLGGSVGIALDSETILRDGRKVGDIEADEQELKKFYLFRSKFALVLILIGFLFQLWGVWQPSPQIPPVAAARAQK